MKRTICSMILTIALFLPAVSLAKKSKWQEIDVVEKYDILYFPVVESSTRGNYVYIVDPKMCLCYASIWGNIAEVDCKKLIKMPEIEPHVQQCAK